MITPQMHFSAFPTLFWGTHHSLCQRGILDTSQPPYAARQQCLSTLISKTSFKPLLFLSPQLFNSCSNFEGEKTLKLLNIFSLCFLSCPLAISSQEWLYQNKSDRSKSLPCSKLSHPSTAGKSRFLKKGHRCVPCLLLSHITPAPYLYTSATFSFFLFFKHTEFILTLGALCSLVPLHGTLVFDSSLILTSNWQTFHFTPIVFPPQYLLLLGIFRQSLSNQNVNFRRVRTFLWSSVFLNHLKWYLVQKRGSSVCWWVNDPVCQSKPNISYLKGDVYIQPS